MLDCRIWVRVARRAGTLTGAATAYIAACAVSPTVSAQVSPEALVKSARILTLAKFVHWPAGSNSASATQLLFCVAAEPSLAVAFTAMAGRRIAGKTIRIEEIRPEAAARCQVLYVGSDPRARATARQAIGSAPILSITTTVDRPEPGFAVTLLPQGEDFVPAVDRSALSVSGLAVASDLLQLVAARDQGASTTP